jgi:hypothetical protein
MSSWMRLSLPFELIPYSTRFQSFGYDSLCPLKPLSSAVASTTPTFTWLIIEQRIVHIPPTPLPKEVEVTTPTSLPWALSPRPGSSRLRTPFSPASKKRFGFFNANSSDPKIPKEKAAPLPQVGEFGESVKSTGDGTVAAEVQKSKEEARTQGSMNGGLALAVGTTAVVVVVARAAQEEIVPAATKDSLSVVKLVIETVPSEPPTVTAPNTDIAAKDSYTPANMGRNGLASRGDEQCRPEPETKIPLTYMMPRSHLRPASPSRLRPSRRSKRLRQRPYNPNLHLLPQLIDFVSRMTPVRAQSLRQKPLPRNLSPHSASEH